MRAPSIKRFKLTRKGVIFAVTLVVLVLAAAVIAVGSRKSACASCHTARAEALEATSHGAISCYSCHLKGDGWSAVGFKARELFVMYPKGLVGRGESGPVTRTSAGACLSCHTDIRGSRSAIVERDGLRVKHSECASGIDSCDTCHGTVAHGKKARGVIAMSMELCTECHVKQEATLECEDCHTSKREEDVKLATPFRVTHGRNWRTTHGLGELDLCKTCHQPDSCVKCHGVAVPHESDFGATHGQAYLKNTKSCATCHDTKTFCKDCHSMEMPHPAGFLQKHSSVAESTTDPKCESCHIMTDCDNCHRRHIHPGGSKGVPVPAPQPDPIPTPGGRS